MKYEIDVCYSVTSLTKENENVEKHDVHDIYTMDIGCLTSSRQITGMIDSIVSNTLLYKPNTYAGYIRIYCPTQEIADVLNQYYINGETICADIHAFRKSCYQFR